MKSDNEIEIPRTLHLNDEEFLNVLIRGRKNLDTLKRAKGEDCTDWGCKHTETNVGICNESLTTLATAYWPKDFPNRKDMRSRGRKHKCPLDKRSRTEANEQLGYGYGCFGGCRFF